MSDQLVVARFKGGDPTQPRFTRTGTIEELMAQLAEKLPVDLVYFLVPHPDGKGYSFREAGLVVLDILHEAIDRARQSPVTPPEPPAPPHYSPEDFDAATGQPEALNEVSPSDYSFSQQEFKFEKPRPQSELLREKGLIPGKKKKPTSKKAKPVAELSDDDLPNPISRGGKVKTTGFRQATQAEAAKASKFGVI